MNNAQLILSFHVKRGSYSGDPSSPFTYLWLLQSNRIKVIIIRKEIKVENMKWQCFSLADDLACFFTLPKILISTQFLTSHIRYDKCSELKLINTKKKPIGLLGEVLITINKP